MVRFLVVFFCCITFIAECPHGVKAAPVAGEVALLSLHVEDAGKYNMLKDAITEMIVAKISSLSGIDCFRAQLSSVDEQRFVQGYPVDSGKYFKMLHADTVAIAYLRTKGKEELSLEVRFYRDSGDRPHVISSTAVTEEKILPALDNLLQKIDISIFDKDTDGILGSMANSETGMKAFLTDHPDKKYKKEEMVEMQSHGVALPSPVVLKVKEELTGLPSDLSSLVLADLDGDGHTELLVATKNGVAVYGYAHGSLHKEEGIGLGDNLTIHAMNVADVDGNGMPEIYVSAAKGSTFASAILSWKPKSGFTMIMHDIPWAIRPLNVPGKGTVVVGQRMLSSTVLEKALWTLQVDTDSHTLQSKDRLSMPVGVNLFDFVYADLDGDGVKEKVVLAGGCLAVFDAQNTMLWASGRGYGESLNSMGGTGSYPGIAPVPTRLLTYDVDGDGGDEIFVVQNDVQMKSGGYEGWSVGRAVTLCLKWQSYTMTELWQTESVGGYLVDIATEDNPETHEGGRLFVAQWAAGSSDKGDSLHNNLLIYDFSEAKPW